MCIMVMYDFDNLVLFENDRRNYFMINLYEIMGQTGIVYADWFCYVRMVVLSFVLLNTCIPFGFVGMTYYT